MAYKFTADDFRRAAEAQGWSEGNGFSTADWKSAMDNPDFGMSLLSHKIDYRDAKTPEARALANRNAENLRSSYYGYTAGTDGSKYYKDQLSPRDFSYEQAPTFSYDLENDPIWGAYKQQYTREGQRAADNTMASAAAMTGGIPSSYAATAAAQARNYYNAQMTDKVPELYQMAYNRYLNELNQYNTDRNFSYGQHMDEIDSQTRERAELLNNAVLAGNYGDFGQLNRLGINTDRNPFDYEREQADWERRFMLAQLSAKYGNTQDLEALGVKTSPSYSGSGGSGGGYSGGTDYADALPDPSANAKASGTEIPYSAWDAAKYKYGYTDADLLKAGFTRPSVPNYSDILGLDAALGITRDQAALKKYGIAGNAYKVRIPGTSTR